MNIGGLNPIVACEKPVSYEIKETDIDWKKQQHDDMNHLKILIAILIIITLLKN